VKQIDAILATKGVIQSIQGSILVDFKEIIDIDHRGFIFDLDVNEYFSVGASIYDLNDNVTLDPSRWTHRNKFNEKVEEYIEQLNLYETIVTKCNNTITGQEIKRIDETIGFVLDSARKYVKGQRRNVPYSERKVKLRATKQFYLSILWKKDSRKVDEKAIEKKRETAGIEMQQ